MAKRTGALIASAVMALAVVVSGCNSIGLGSYNINTYLIMTCTKPIEIGGDLSFPCGKCMSCRVQRTQEWALRLMDESSQHKQSVFVTLTYSDQELPEPPLVSKRELQLFLKRLRKEYDKPIKYYASGEYGENLGRPHYHLLIFGMSIADKQIIEQCWMKGIVHVGTVTLNSCRYVASYIQKKLYNKPNEKNSTVFSLSSRGLGLGWALANRQYLADNQRITHEGVAHSIPRYYVKKLGLDLSESQDARIKEESEAWKRVENDLNETDTDIFTTNLRSKVQQDRNVVGRTALKEKKL